MPALAHNPRMHRFATLYQQLDATTATGEKVAAMRSYFADPAVAEADKAWALWLLLGNRLKRLIAPSLLRQWAGEATGLSPALVEASYSQVGDLAETISLLVDTARSGAEPMPLDTPTATVSETIAGLQALAGLPVAEQRAAVLRQWAALPREASYLFTKLLTGSLRVGVSAGLAARALAEHAGLPPPLLQQRLAGEWPPSAERYAALLDPLDAAVADPSQPYPFCLASPLEAAAESLGEAGEWLAEWKWDGIRAQVIRRAGQTWVWSRGEELLNGRFPEVEALAARWPDGTVVDGEVLASRDGAVLPFALLQKRIGRKSVGKKLLEDAPVSLLAYDLLEWQGEDWRARPLVERRTQLEALAATTGLRVSERLAGDWAALAALREEARGRGVEGLMLKRLDSAYLTGRKRGAWFKWKIGALSFDGVLLYAQAGHGRRANLYTDYTLGVWTEEPRTTDEGPATRTLVPVAKAYSGLTDEELLKMDRWIRSHTRETFGPVRSVDAVQVFEIAFEGIQKSTRHKAGVALRFPRIARWRTDKKPEDADTLESLRALLNTPS